MLRVVSWNCRRASATHALWRYLADLAPDVAVLQEVSSLPQDLLQAYNSRIAVPVGKTGKPQRFRSVLLVRGEIVEETSLRSTTEWVNAELTHFATNLPVYRIRTPTIADLMVVNVYSPAWPVDRVRLQGHDVAAVKLKQNPDVWVTDLLVTALREHLASTRAEWLIAGDFNSCESFDQWKGGPRGNREWLDRMTALGLRECLRLHQGALTPTFRRPGTALAKSQIDHIFATTGLSEQLVTCTVGAASVVYDQGFSDHLPIIADFRTDAPAA